MTQGPTPPGWYHADGDPPGTQRYWDGSRWTTDAQPASGAAGQPGGFPAQGGFPPQQGGFPPAGAAPAGPYGYQAGAPGYLPELGKTLADPGQRIVARLIDAVIGFVIALVLLAIVGVENAVNSVGFLFVGAIVGIAYEVVMVALKGGTLGKLIMGIGVVTTDGTYPPGWEPAVKRWLPSLAGYIPVIGGLIGLVIFIVSLVWLFKDERRRTVYDKVGGTYVIKTK